jgi:hypothetical protein
MYASRPELPLAVAILIDQLFEVERDVDCFVCLPALAPGFSVLANAGSATSYRRPPRRAGGQRVTEV